ncbi:uncharacterized protein LOC108659662 [Drosophila navojoa]|nr:uncharacterized protein LOC108659662 [Drosophila navojoa]
MVGSTLAVEELPDPNHPEPPLQPSKGAPKPGNKANTTEKEDTRLVNVPFTECKPNEVFTVNKGCVNRKAYMKNIVLRNWNNNNTEEIQCAINEVQTMLGCEPLGTKLRDSDAPRAAVLPNYLYGKRIYNTKEAIPQTEDKEEVLNGDAGTDPGDKRSEKSEGRHLPVGELEGNTGAAGATQGGSGNAEDVNEILQKVIGHNRKRKYSFLPGRLLTTYRKCRPYEVLGKGRRCIRKKGKVGFYKHRSHVYGSQNRHRHPSIYKSKRGQR